MDYNFFEKFNIDPLAFDRSGLKWDVLEAIGEDFSGRIPQLQEIADDTVSDLLHCEKIHSVNYRIKDREHLIEKIIRKCVTGQENSIDRDNYSSVITDLIGVRVLHLYREDWTRIHEYLCSKWSFAEPPIAYIRQGDPDKLSRFYIDNDCIVKEHPHGYRSVHYVLSAGDGSHSVEIQTRTLFEEAWGEIDHSVRYPYYSDNEILGRLSSILSRLAADADDLGTYMRFLKSRTAAREEEHRTELRDKNRIIDSLREQINALSIGSEEKQLLNKELRSLKSTERDEYDDARNFPWLDDLVGSSLFRNISSKVEEFLNKSDIEKVMISNDDIDVMKNAQKGLMELLKNPSQLKKLLESPFAESETEKGD